MSEGQGQSETGGKDLSETGGDPAPTGEGARTSTDTGMEQKPEEIKPALEETPSADQSEQAAGESVTQEEDNSKPADGSTDVVPEGPAEQGEAGVDQAEDTTKDGADQTNGEQAPERKPSAEEIPRAAADTGADTEAAAKTTADEPAQQKEDGEATAQSVPDAAGVEADGTTDTPPTDNTGAATPVGDGSGKAEEGQVGQVTEGQTAGEGQQQEGQGQEQLPKPQGQEEPLEGQGQTAEGQGQTAEGQGQTAEGQAQGSEGQGQHEGTADPQQVPDASNATDVPVNVDKAGDAPPGGEQKGNTVCCVASVEC